MTKGKSLRDSHLVIIRRNSSIIICIILIIKRGLGRMRGRRSKTNHASLSVSNASYSSVHLTHLTSESIQTTTKVNMYLLKLLHDGLKGHTTNCRVKMSGRSQSWRGWNSRSCRIHRLHMRPFRLKLSLTPLDRTSTNGTHNGKERWERNGNKEVCEDPRDNQKKDELIMGSCVSINIYNL